MTAVLVALLLGLPPSPADEGRLSLADLAEYPDALAPTSSRATPARFRDLWERPETYRGRRVEVAGRVERRFRSAAVGRLPALEEAWIVTPEGDPLCLVYPAGRDGAAIGSEVRFAGTFLRRLRYPSGDGDRLAPLIVGGKAPAVRSGTRPVPSIGWSPRDWAVAGTLVAVVGIVLVLNHLRRPPRRPERPGPPPVFDQPDEPAAEPDRDAS